MQKGSGCGKTAWTCVIWNDLRGGFAGPPANSCGILCTFCQFHLKDTFLLPQPSIEETVRCIFFKVVSIYLASGNFASHKWTHESISKFNYWLGFRFVNPFWETWWKCFTLLHQGLGNDGSSEETEISQVNQWKDLGDLWQISDVDRWK